MGIKVKRYNFLNEGSWLRPLGGSYTLQVPDEPRELSTIFTPVKRDLSTLFTTTNGG